jgi:putative phage-type endonuclease
MTTASDRAEWLERRLHSLGASEVPAVLGVDPRRGPTHVYASKLGLVRTEETSQMRMGRRMEPVIADEYAERTGRLVRNLGAFTIKRHPDLPFLTATLDREVIAPDQAGPGPLECKAVWAGKAADFDVEPPVQHMVQLQTQMAVTGASWGSLAALIGGLEFWWADIPRNDAFIAAMLPQLEAFWRHVTSREPPPADGTDGTRVALHALYPKDSGETIAMPPQALEQADRLDKLREEIDAREDEKATLEAQVKAALGFATWGVLTDGSRWQWKVEPRAGHAVAPSAPRVLRRVGRPKTSTKKGQTNGND